MSVALLDRRQGRAQKRYTAETIDWPAVHDHTTERVYYIPAAELGSGMLEMTLRVDPARKQSVAAGQAGSWLHDYLTGLQLTRTGP
jgi:hypothetical protein